MSKKFALLIAVVLCLAVVSPALAYIGVGGQVLDSQTPQEPWTWGGDVIVMNRSTGLPVALCSLDLAGNIVGAPGDLTPATCDFADFLFGMPIPVPPPLLDEDIEIQIDFNCLLTGLCSGGPAGTPAPLSFMFKGAPLTSGYYMIPPDNGTGTGPNAVQLSGMSSASSLGIALVLAVVAGGSVVLKKMVKREPETDYISPKVVHEGVLEVQAGTVLEEINDGLFGVLN